MNDIDENIIKELLNKPPDFEFNEKPWYSVKSRLDYEIKMKRFKLFTLVFGIILVGIMAVLGNYFYEKKIKEYENTINLIGKNKQKLLLTKTDTIYKENIVYIHDTLYKTIKVFKTLSSISDNRFNYFNKHKQSSSNSIFLLDRNHINQNIIYGKEISLSGIGSIPYRNPIYYNIPLYTLNKQHNKIDEIEKLSIIQSYLKNKIKIRYGNDILYKQWLNELTIKTAKEKETIKYKFNKFMTGFNPVRYEVEPQIGGIYSLTIKKPNIGLFTGLNAEVLLENGIKSIVGINWVNYHDEYKAKYLTDNDFPKSPENDDIFDGIYLDQNYFLFPIGIEYHIRHYKRLHPLIGVGWTPKIYISNIVKYEFHNIKTFEEYKISKTFNKQVDYNNYWITAGLNYNFTSKFGSSLKAKYIFGIKNYNYNFLNTSLLAISFNTYYRF